jgi:pyruvate/2-oxoacid:ferredoxin oxidoreductase beta subunit
MLSLTENVNILVLDTQCYSNTGGQASKATPLGAVSFLNRFHRLVQLRAQRNLRHIDMTIHHHADAKIFARLASIQEAEAYPGPSLIIAYSPCEEHGYDLALSHDQMWFSCAPSEICAT